MFFITKIFGYFGCGTAASFWRCSIPCFAVSNTNQFTFFVAAESIVNAWRRGIIMLTSSWSIVDCKVRKRWYSEPDKKINEVAKRQSRAEVRHVYLISSK